MALDEHVVAVVGLRAQRDTWSVRRPVLGVRDREGAVEVLRVGREAAGGRQLERRVDGRHRVLRVVALTLCSAREGGEVRSARHHAVDAVPLELQHRLGDGARGHDDAARRAAVVERLDLDRRDPGPAERPEELGRVLGEAVVGHDAQLVHAVEEALLLRAGGVRPEVGVRVVVEREQVRREPLHLRRRPDRLRIRRDVGLRETRRVLRTCRPSKR